MVTVPHHSPHHHITRTAALYRLIKIFVWCEIVWYIFSDIYTIPFLLYSILSSVVVTLAIVSISNHIPNFKISPRGIFYVIILLKDIVVSSWFIIKTVWKEQIELKPILREVSYTSLEKELTTILHSNAITLTPSTIVLGIHENSILVHGLAWSLLSDLPGRMYNKIIK